MFFGKKGTGRSKGPEEYTGAYTAVQMEDLAKVITQYLLPFIKQYNGLYGKAVQVETVLSPPEGQLRHSCNFALQMPDFYGQPQLHRWLLANKDKSFWDEFPGALENGAASLLPEYGIDDCYEYLADQVVRSCPSSESCAVRLYFALEEWSTEYEIPDVLRVVW